MATEMNQQDKDGRFNVFNSSTYDTQTMLRLRKDLNINLVN